VLINAGSVYDKFYGNFISRVLQWFTAIERIMSSMYHIFFWTLN